MEDQAKQMMAKALLGDGMAAQAGNTMQLHPMWQQEMAQRQMDGQAPIPFEQWVQMRQQPQMMGTAP